MRVVLRQIGRATRWVALVTAVPLAVIAPSAATRDAATRVATNLAAAPNVLVIVTDDQRKGMFKPEVNVAADASAQDKLLAYTGRDPAR